MIRIFISFILSILLIIIPVISTAIEPVSSGTQQAIIDATDDARKDVNFPLWFAAGCVFVVFGVGAAYLMVPSPKPSRFLGKSADYITMYVHQYRKVIRSRQTLSAFAGCAAMTGTAIIIAIISASQESDPNQESCSCSWDDPFGINSCVNSTNNCLSTGEGCSTQSGNCLDSGSGCLGGDSE